MKKLQNSNQIILAYDLGKTWAAVEILVGSPAYIKTVHTGKFENFGAFLDNELPKVIERAHGPENVHIVFEQPPRGEPIKGTRKADWKVIPNLQREAEHCVALILDACRRYNIKIKYPKGFMPNTVKKAVTGNGKASKIQVREMVDFLLEGISLSPDPGYHKHDACAVGYCLMNRLHLGGEL